MLLVSSFEIPPCAGNHNLLKKVDRQKASIECYHFCEISTVLGRVSDLRLLSEITSMHVGKSDEDAVTIVADCCEF